MLLSPSILERSQLARVKPHNHWRFIRNVALLALVMLVGYQVSRRLFGWNLHTVITGQVYRGAQPTPELVEELAKNYGVRTIINLRGCGLPNAWYAKETEAVQRLGLNQEDICFSALRLPSSMELRRLVDVLDKAQYPIYLHCRRGADRTGLASAILMLLQPDGTVQKPSPSLGEARSQLGLWYGHVALGKTRVLDQFFDLYEDWLNKNGQIHDQATFRHWLLEEYNGGWCSAKFEEFTPLAPAAHTGAPIGYRVRVRNTGTKDWQLRASSQSGNHLAYQVWDGERLLAEGRAGLLDKRVPPGESLAVTLVVKPLKQTGRFRLIVDMAEEKHCWFYQTGSEPHEEELVVVE
jgi:protein tyrosine phosphatase (PTP) superfamily phosphohydrolase (DUF442 family)